MRDSFADELEAWSERRGLPEPLDFVAETTSTNAVLKAAAAHGAPHGTTLVADAQTAGRGRLGRTWLSPSGANVYLSVVLRPRLPVARLPLVVLAAGVATVEACGRPCRLKWPNDVLDGGGRKVAGILAEAELASQRVDWVVVGIGVNVAAAPTGAPQAACLERVLGRPIDRAELATGIVAGLLTRVAQVEREPAAVLEAWRAWDGTIGRRVRVGAVEGVAIGMGPDGALEVRDDAGVEHRVLAGDVEMVRVGEGRR